MTAAAPRSIALIVVVTLVALLGGTIAAFPSYAARPSTRIGALDTEVGPAATASWRGCRPSPTPTPRPTPSPTPSTAPSPSASIASGPAVNPSGSPDASTSPSRSPSPSPRPSRPPRATPTPYIPPGVDVSVYQGALDWSLIKAAGMKFAFIRATAGLSTVDAKFAQHVRRARAQGMLIGAYHFFDYTADGLAQADRFIDTAAANGMLTDALPLAVDIECLGSYGWSVWAKAVPQLRAFVDRVYERTGRKPILYTSRTMWRQVMGNDRGFSDLPLWVACWRCDPPLLPVGWKTWRFWQIRPYAIPGIARKMDGNVFKGTDESLELWRGQPMVINGGAKVTGDRLVTLDLGSVTGTEVRTDDDAGAWTDWAAIAKPVQHQLTPGEGERTVRAQVRRADGLEGPIVADRIILDQTGPVVGAPTVRVRPAATVSKKGFVPITATWTATDQWAGVSSSTLIHDCGAGLTGEAAPGSIRSVRAGQDGRTRVQVAGGVPSAVDGAVPQGTCRLTARAVDGVGNESAPSARTNATVSIADDQVAAPVHRPSWVTRARVGAYGGTVLRTIVAGAAVKLQVTGDSVGIVATQGPGFGRMTIRLDGVVIATVDLYRPTLAVRQVVAAFALPKGGTHTIRLSVEPRSNPKAKGGHKVELDAVLTTLNASGPAPGPDPSTAPAAAPSTAP
ncbi:MAG: glycoside hydrolase family 25 protein [Chloroflexota bacterium]